MITVLLVCVLLFGVRVRGVFCLDKLTVRLEISVFRDIRALYMRIFCLHGVWYYVINNGAYHILKLKDKKGKKDSKNIARMALPKVFIDKLTINVRIGDENTSISPLIFALITDVTLDIVYCLVGSYVEIENFEKCIIPYQYKYGLYIDVTAWLGIKSIKTIYGMIRYFLIRRRGNNAARQYDREYSRQLKDSGR